MPQTNWRRICPACDCEWIGPRDSHCWNCETPGIDLPGHIMVPVAQYQQDA